MHLYLSRRRENFQKKDLLVLTATWAESVLETRLTPIFKQILQIYFRSFPLKELDQCTFLAEIYFRPFFS